ncbi:AraC-like DNA-binding protein/mannose-6-phosphate isomerase-like protein (cupin superfamily) [Mycobacterium frederiksbergense]|uniref:AraC-like DNA-binding protein/mannose-6-phosphate isomerase-like protein (Cupin superfamily) n=1 Tax=Mycolicibacterium frederiksbergense TaxID=117567 RepID=A0ABT6L3G5_9MYCO|nr:helix-turn-helix transcriptional regulator [Mycolicibacterium frederiksbergense]MDH6197481.1 AraC-like DNA-binding protein/mannose-6-phosphate isomerase-like protein (cupin superfamily) [Mycolicibacterium frederiksbergense]
MRNVAADDFDDVPRAVLPVGTDYPDGFVLDWHSHRRAQFLHSATGVMVVETAHGAWTVPTDLAVLIPPGVAHLMRTQDVSTRSLYIEPAAVPWWPDSCVVVQVTPLLRELLLVAVDFDLDYDLSGRDGAVVTLLLHEIAALTPVALHVSLPAATDLAMLCREYLAAPDVSIGNAQWAARTNLGERAFTRRFRTETGVSPAVWRRRARLLAAVPLLRGATVTEVANRLGYATPAAFTAAFTAEFGLPPSRMSRLASVHRPPAQK